MLKICFDFSIGFWLRLDIERIEGLDLKSLDDAKVFLH